MSTISRRPARALMVALLALSTACAQGGYGQPQAPDLGDDADMGAHRQKDMTIAPDQPKDPDTPATLQPTQSTSNTGANTLKTPKHRVRFILGAPSPTSTHKTTKHTLRLGAGSAQHGQGR